MPAHALDTAAAAKPRAALLGLKRGFTGQAEALGWIDQLGSQIMTPAALRIAGQLPLSFDDVHNVTQVVAIHDNPCAGRCTGCVDDLFRAHQSAP
jgi:hypothetical protein